MSGVSHIKQQTHNRFLNFYELDATERDGKNFPYYMASRAEETAQLEIRRPERKADGVMIFALYGNDHIVLIHQYRYPLGHKLYELPAGLIEDGEDYHDAAVREMKEETGLTLNLVRPDPLFERPTFPTAGLTDEKCNLVYGYAEGEPGMAGLEPTEDIRVRIADRAEARRILSGESCAMACAHVLMHFISDPEPFRFLQVT